jgi:predicted nucleic acid-binding protein
VIARIVSSESGESMICIDSYGWIERLLDGPKASAYNRVFSSVPPPEILTSAVTVLEGYKKLRPMKGEAAALGAMVDLRATTLVPFDDPLALEAADYSLSLGLHFSNAIFYATAQRFRAELHTSDPELRGVLGVVFH